MKVLDHHPAYTESCTWRKLIVYLLEIDGLFSDFSDWFCNLKQVLWKLDAMESCSRMRQCFKRSYQGFNHSGSTTNYIIDAQLQYEPLSSITSEIEASLKTFVPCITSEIERKDGREAVGNDTVADSVDNDQSSFPYTKEHSADFDNSPHQNVTQSTSTMLPDERIIIILSSSIVHTLKVVKGTLQITSKRINYIVDEHNGKCMISSLSVRKKNREKTEAG